MKRHPSNSLTSYILTPVKCVTQLTSVEQCRLAMAILISELPLEIVSCWLGGYVTDLQQKHDVRCECN